MALDFFIFIQLNSLLYPYRFNYQGDQPLTLDISIFMFLYFLILKNYSSLMEFSHSK